MLFIERLVEKKGVVVGRSRETGGGTSSFRVREYASDVNSTGGGRGGGAVVPYSCNCILEPRCRRRVTAKAHCGFRPLDV